MGGENPAWRRVALQTSRLGDGRPSPRPPRQRGFAWDVLCQVASHRWGLDQVWVGSLFSERRGGFSTDLGFTDNLMAKPALLLIGLEVLSRFASWGLDQG